MSGRLPTARPERVVAGATQFRERAADSRLRSIALLLLVALSTLAVCIIAGLVVGLLLVPLVAADGLLIGAALGALGAVLYSPVLIWTWAKSGDIVLRAAAARPSSTLAAQTARNVVAEVAVAAGIPTPATAFIDGTTPKALAVGKNAHAATIALTPSLVDVLTRQQLQAVVAHEIGHVVNGDIRFKSFLAAVGLRFDMVGLSLTAPNRSFNDTTGPLEWIEVVLYGIVSLCGLAAKIVGLAAAREREFLADFTAVGLTRDPLALAEALTILDRLNPSGFGDRSNPLGQMLIVDPADGSARFKSHPTLDERLDRLQALAEEMGARD